MNAKIILGLILTLKICLYASTDNILSNDDQAEIARIRNFNTPLNDHMKNLWELHVESDLRFATNDKFTPEERKKALARAVAFADYIQTETSKTE